MAAITEPAHLPRAAEIGPRYTLDQDKHTSTLRVGDWTIVATSKPILNGKEADALEKRLSLPLPEIVFGNNSLSLTHAPPGGADSEATSIRFDALGALSSVAVGEGWEERVGGGVLVSAAETWGRSRPHDWTYSTTYAGDIAGPSSFRESSSHSLPLKLLARQDPVADRILFYNDVVLFEDELHDFGDSKLNVRIRVMPHCFFILSRLFVRVDGVLFRIFDVRIYHAFGSSEIIRETSGLEADYAAVKQRLEKSEDLTPLTDQNFVYSTLLQLPPGPARPGKPWPGLGKRVDVLTLPSAEATRAQLEQLSL